MYFFFNTQKVSKNLRYPVYCCTVTHPGLILQKQVAFFQYKTTNLVASHSDLCYDLCFQLTQKDQYQLVFFKERNKLGCNNEQILPLAHVAKH